MGNLFSKKSKSFGKRKLEEEIDICEQPNAIISNHNNSVISVNTKEISLSVPNGRRHDELEEDRQRVDGEVELKKELEEVKTRLGELLQQNELLSGEVDKFKRDYENGSGKIRHQIEATLAEKLSEERELVQNQISQQIDIKFKDQDSSVNKLFEASRASIVREISQQQSEHAYEEVESLKELIRILSISTVVKNTAHLNFSPTEAMDIIEIKISFQSGTEKKNPRMINVQNLMRITTVHELKYHLAEKYKHLKVGELVIKWKGIELADTATLLEYGICNKDKLELEVRALVTYMILIQLDKDNQLQIEVTPATKIRFLKEWLQEKTSIAVEKQQLRHGDNLLQDEKRLAECQIGEGEVIKLEVCFVGYFSIHVACPSGVKHQIEVEPKDTIETVKLQVSNKQHIHVNQFDLLVKGNFAETSKKLYEYNIIAGETLHLRMCTPPPNTNMFPTPFQNY